jgi:glutaredoxin-like YruB-family protein
MKKVSIYSTPWCHFCQMAKEFFKANSIAYTEFDVSKDMERRKEMIDKTHQMGVPVIDIDGKLIVGFNQDVIAKELGVKTA